MGFRSKKDQLAIAETGFNLYRNYKLKSVSES